MEGAVEGVQEGGAEGVGDLGEGEVEVEEGARIYGAIKVGIEPENEPGRRPSRYGIRSDTKKTVRATLERAVPVRNLEGRSAFHICELHICSSGHYTGRF